MRYRVVPGLYALNHPGPGSPVLVTANYKLSFDRLREAVADRDAWVLVLDTHGVNVWCAAGKGTFGTDELVQRIASSGLEQLVSGRTVILPQLAGPGVAAFEVRKRCGFRAVFGPVRAEDLPAYLDAGGEATPAMRRKTFPIADRVALVPVELVGALKVAAPVALGWFLASGLGGPSGFWTDAVGSGTGAIVALLAGVGAGAVLTPLLLPWLPGRAFSFKGLMAGVPMAVAVAAGLRAWPPGGEVQSWLLLLAWGVVVLTVSSFLGMSFTGASTFTSLSGVRWEMRRAVPLQVAGAVVALGLWASARWIG